VIGREGNINDLFLDHLSPRDGLYGLGKPLYCLHTVQASYCSKNDLQIHGPQPSMMFFDDLKQPRRPAFRVTVRQLLSLGIVLMAGCGATKSFTATEQLLMSDAVDSTLSKMDFRAISGHKVFLDTTYVLAAGKVIPGVAMPVNLVNSDYVISGLRQQLTAAGCMLVDSKDAAEIICEARCGALGTDGHSVTYGIPANNFLSGASSIIPGTPTLPTIPELSVAKREMKSAAAKVSVFAYDRETREPLWQSGIAQAGSSARDTWILGVGPLQYGNIYKGTRFAGKRIQPFKAKSDESQLAQRPNGVDHRSSYLFAHRLFGKDLKSEAVAEVQANGESKNNAGSPVRLSSTDSNVPAVSR
jgi:hypothetical protein